MMREKEESVRYLNEGRKGGGRPFDPNGIGLLVFTIEKSAQNRIFFAKLWMPVRNIIVNK